jgi:hypothetical protein
MPCYALVPAEQPRGWMCLAGAMGGHTVVAKLLVEFGTREQQERYPPRNGDGCAAGTMAFTEPGGGSDLQNMSTVPRPHGDEYVIDGPKTWISTPAAPARSRCCARGRTSPGRPPARAPQPGSGRAAGGGLHRWDSCRPGQRVRRGRATGPPRSGDGFAVDGQRVRRDGQRVRHGQATGSPWTGNGFAGTGNGFAADRHGTEGPARCGGSGGRSPAGRGSGGVAPRRRGHAIEARAFRGHDKPNRVPPVRLERTLNGT